MTTDTFMRNYGIKKKGLVTKWITEELIPGANLDEDYIPDSARPPYTKARAKNAKSIYYSIVIASHNRQHVLPKLYKICQEEFNGYINRLAQANLIDIRVTDNITYYDATLSATDVNKKFILDALERCSKGIAQGVTEAALKQASGV